MLNFLYLFVILLSIIGNNCKIPQYPSSYIIDKLKHDVYEWANSIIHYSDENLDNFNDMIMKYLMKSKDATIKNTILKKDNELYTDKHNQNYNRKYIELYHNTTNHQHMKTDRNLQQLNIDSFCYSGVPVWINATFYNCYGNTLDEESYQTYKQTHPDADSTCVQRNDSEIACYCPYEFSHKYCNYQDYISCDIQVLNPNKSCNGSSSDAYLYNIDGDPPCYKVSSSDSVKFEFIFNCTNYDPSTSYEGVKSIPKNYKAPPPGSIPLAYKINKKYLKLTYAQQFTLRVQFIPWNRYWNYKNFDFNLTAHQVTGDLVTVYINASELKGFEISGRYFYLIQLLWNTSFPIQKTLEYGYFEDSDFVESPAPHKFKLIYIIGIILTCLIIFGIIFLISYKYYKKRYNTFPEDNNYANNNFLIR